MGILKWLLPDEPDRKKKTDDADNRKSTKGQKSGNDKAPAKKKGFFEGGEDITLEDMIIMDILDED